MRRILATALTGLFLPIAATGFGCGPSEKARVPEKMMDLPKEGPAPVGGMPKGKGAPLGAGQESSAQ